MRWRAAVPVSCSSVKFSPFFENRIAVTTSQNFGIVGNGGLHVLETSPQGIRPLVAYETLDGLYDCAWSEENENVVAAACGDGSVKVYDIAQPPQANPLRSFHEHQHECCSVSWNSRQRQLFLSSSWDDSIKLWSLGAPASLRTFLGHTYCVYQVQWNHQQPDVFLSVSGDLTFKVWDLRRPAGPSLSIAAHQGEVLTADWCKYNDCLLATGSVDKSIKVWDVRQPGRELALLQGHAYAVRRVVFSPHAQSLLLTCSYDMTVKLWDTADPVAPLKRSWDHHTEFVTGLDMSPHSEGVLASASWDTTACVWHASGFP